MKQAFRRAIPWVLATASLALPACQAPNVPPRLDLVNHTEGQGIWRDEQNAITVQAPGADRVVFNLPTGPQTSHEAPFELPIASMPNGAVPFTIEAYFPNEETLSLESGAYIKDPANACTLNSVIEPISRSDLEAIIADRTDTEWYPDTFPDESRNEVVMTPLDEELYTETLDLVASVLQRVDRGFLDATKKLFLVESITFNGTRVAGLNNAGRGYAAISARPSDIENFTHTVISENATIQTYRYFEADLFDAWDATNPNGYSNLTFEEYLNSGLHTRLPDLNADLLKEDNFVNHYAATDRSEDMSQFIPALYLHPDRMLYFATTTPHTGAKLDVYDEAFSPTRMGIEYVECLAHER